MSALYIRILLYGAGAKVVNMHCLRCYISFFDAKYALSLVSKEVRVQRIVSELSLQ